MTVVGESVWSIVVPVKPLPAAKTRLRGGVPGVDHELLVLAFALDTVAAALACPTVIEVLVVTDDAVMGKALAELGAFVVPDKPDAGLNEAVRYGASLASRGATHCAALAADLPALRPAELGAALTAATGPRCFVPDAPGTGTVLLAAPAGVPLDPRFGPGSARAHGASGALPLAGDWPSLRRDVDMPADLAEAAALGLGRHTVLALAPGRAGPPSP
jgi:2-phospho-L-lactate/phosphoenolpyruvate guanylyltransferase